MAGFGVSSMFQPSYKNIAIRNAIHFHLGVHPTVQAEQQECYVARHHYHPHLLDYLLDDNKFSLKVCLTTPLPANKASRFGTSGRLNMFPMKPSNLSSNQWMNVRDKAKLMAVPNYGVLKVKSLVEQSQSPRKERMKLLVKKRTHPVDSLAAKEPPTKTRRKSVDRTNRIQGQEMCIGLDSDTASRCLGWRGISGEALCRG